MRFRLSILVAGVSLLGCTLFTPLRSPSISNRTIGRASNVCSNDLRSVAPGDWCRVTLRPANYGVARRQAEYVGKIEQITLESLTLINVASRVWTEDSPVEKIPLLNRLTATDRTMKEQPAPVELSLDGIASIDRIAPEDVAVIKHGRIAINAELQFHQRVGDERLDQPSP